MKNEDIHGSQINQSPSKHDVHASRLDVGMDGWIPTPIEDSWLQINLLRQTIMTGLITQGQSRNTHFLTGYNVITSLNGANWDNVTDADGKFEVGLPSTVFRSSVCLY